MTTTAQRNNLLILIDEACKSGARLHLACKQIGLTCRTVQRWLLPCAQAQEESYSLQAANGDEPAVAQRPEQLVVAGLVCKMSVNEDHRQAALRQAVIPSNKFTPEECAAVMSVINNDEFKDLPPSQIVPRLADQGRYLASESTMQRILRRYHQNTHRRTERAAQKRQKPFELKATAVNQVYTWDITYLPTLIKGIYLYLYLFIDIFSRYIVGWQVYDSESAEHAGALLTDICLRNRITKGQVTLHSDNGSPMKGETMLATMQRLGISASRSRPSVSNDNPYSESLFRTLKYRPDMPVKPFEDITQARHWVELLVNWYNYEHRHSAISFVTPQQRHTGQDVEILTQRSKLYEQARLKNPQRWSKNTRNWNRVNVVHLNPDKPMQQGDL